MRLLVFFTLLAHADGLPVFDCRSTDTKFRVVDLLEPKECPEPDRDYAEPKSTLIQVLQTDTNVPILGYQCKVTLSKEVTRCGFSSITYASQYPVWKQDYEIAPNQCREALTQKMLTVQNVNYRIEIGVQTHKSFIARGKLYPDGGCDTASFVAGGKEFYGAYERTEIEIYIRRIRGMADHSTGEVLFTNGLHARVKDDQETCQ